MSVWADFDTWAEEQRTERNKMIEPQSNMVSHPYFIRGILYERERILDLLKAQPTALEFYEPYVATDKLIKEINTNE